MRLALILISILLLFFSGTLLAQNKSNLKQYGSFILHRDQPTVLYLLSEIKQDDSFDLRRALRENPVEKLVLSSPGGLVYEALQMAGILNDKKINTYIPKGASCASACTFLFFAGSKRQSDGQLGVHQFGMRDKDKGRVGLLSKQDESVQFTVAEIIGFLNEFNTPPFVYEKMFSDKEMYFFTKQELNEINEKFYSDNDLKLLKKIDETLLILANSNQQKTKPQEIRVVKLDELTPLPNSEKEQIKLFQTSLAELGCDPGKIDGKWGVATETALRFAASSLLVNFDKSLVSNKSFLNRLNEAKSLEICRDFISYNQFKAYDNAYIDGIERCINQVPLTTNYLIDSETCYWRNDEKILQERGLLRLYDLAYDRYKNLFSLAKTSTINYHSGLISYEQHINNTHKKALALNNELTKRMARSIGIMNLPYR